CSRHARADAASAQLVAKPVALPRGADRWCLDSMHQQRGHAARAHDIACHAAEERLSPGLMSVAAHHQDVSTSFVSSLEQQGVGALARLSEDLVVFRDDAMPGEMVENRWDIVVITVADRNHQ